MNAEHIYLYVLPYIFVRIYSKHVDSEMIRGGENFYT